VWELNVTGVPYVFEIAQQERLIPIVDMPAIRPSAQCVWTVWRIVRRERRTSRFISVWLIFNLMTLIDAKSSYLSEQQSLASVCCELAPQLIEALLISSVHQVRRR
jgi:hypothetical protein